MHAHLLTTPSKINASKMEMAVPQLQELAQKKEEELQKIREQQAHALETALKTIEEELDEERGKRKALEGDFKYNLGLIEQRDQELLQYETVFQQLKKVKRTLLSVYVIYSL